MKKAIAKVVAMTVLAGASFMVANVSHAADGKALAQKHQCLSCHAVDKKLVGPSYQDVAAKYKGDKSAVAKLSAKVKAGGVGTWGNVPMPANGAVPDKDVETIVKWVLAGAK